MTRLVLPTGGFPGALWIAIDNPSKATGLAFRKPIKISRADILWDVVGKGSYPYPTQDLPRGGQSGVEGKFAWQANVSILKI